MWVQPNAAEKAPPSVPVRATAFIYSSLDNSLVITFDHDKIASAVYQKIPAGCQAFIQLANDSIIIKSSSSSPERNGVYIPKPDNYGNKPEVAIHFSFSKSERRLL